MQRKKDDQEFSAKRVKFFDDRKSSFRQISDNQRIEIQEQKRKINKK